MAGPCPVVRVVSAEHEAYGGFKEINESDFDPEVHVRWSEADEFSEMPVADMKALLKASGVEFKEKATAEALRELCRSLGDLK